VQIEYYQEKQKLWPLVCKTFSVTKKREYVELNRPPHVTKANNEGFDLDCGM